MRILKKVLKLNYAEEKGDKQVVKSYTSTLTLLSMRLL